MGVTITITKEDKTVIDEYKPRDRIEDYKMILTGERAEKGCVCGEYKGFCQCSEYDRYLVDDEDLTSDEVLKSYVKEHGKVYVEFSF